jgi:hypothetical protein
MSNLISSVPKVVIIDLTLSLFDGEESELFKIPIIVDANIWFFKELSGASVS